MRMLRLLLVLLAGLGGLPAVAASPVLVVTGGGATRQFTADDLLGLHDAATLAVPRDPAYGRAMSYRAVPLSALLSALPPDEADTIQARAIDGFVAEILRTLIGGAAVPWLAIEDPAHLWPHLPGKTVAQARAILAFTPREVARDWSKLLESAVANAEANHELVEDDLIIRAAYADEGPTIRRFRPRAMGRATPIRKRTSHLTIMLSPGEGERSKKRKGKRVS